MARLGVTYQDIANAADQLLGQGKPPTIELIRHLLGTGSTTTIANHLRKWRAEQDGSTSVASKENLPQEFVSLMKGLWQRLQAHADGQIANIKQESEEITKHLSQDLEKYKANNQRWQKMHDAWMKEKDAYAREKLGLEQAIISYQKDNSALTARHEAEQQRIAELHRLHTLAQENLEHFRESTRVQRLIEQEKQAQQLQQQEALLKNTEHQLTTINHDKMSLQKQLYTISNEHAALEKSSDAVNIKLGQFQADYAALEITHAEIKRDSNHLQSQFDALTKKHAEQCVVLIDQQKQQTIIAQQLLMAQADVKELKDQNKFLAREKWEIAQEKAQLEGASKQMQKMIRTKEGVL